MIDSPIVSIAHLVKNFGTFQAIKDVSLSVYPGDVYGFLGPNGAGKSTTMRCMLSLIHPDGGNIELFGKNIATERHAILSRIGCLIEKPDFYKYLSAYQNLAQFSRVSGNPSSKKAIMEMLDFVGLLERANDHVSGFSHGMRQRLGIAQTLLHDPDIIILDEPTTGLDPQGIIDMRNLILQLKNERKKTIILSSHHLSEVELICNRMVIINKGESILEGSVQDLLADQAQIMRIETAAKDQAKAMSALAPHSPVAINAVWIEIEIDKASIPAVHAHLVAEGVAVFAMESKRKLEDYFIKLLAA